MNWLFGIVGLIIGLAVGGGLVYLFKSRDKITTEVKATVDAAATAVKDTVDKTVSKV